MLPSIPQYTPELGLSLLKHSFEKNIPLDESISLSHRPNGFYLEIKSEEAQLFWENLEKPKLDKHEVQYLEQTHVNQDGSRILTVSIPYNIKQMKNIYTMYAIDISEELEEFKTLGRASANRHIFFQYGYNHAAYLFNTIHQSTLTYTIVKEMLKDKVLSLCEPSFHFLLSICYLHLGIPNKAKFWYHFACVRVLIDSRKLFLCEDLQQNRDIQEVIIQHYINRFFWSVAPENDFDKAPLRETGPNLHKHFPQVVEKSLPKPMYLALEVRSLYQLNTEDIFFNDEFCRKIEEAYPNAIEAYTQRFKKPAAT